MLMSREKDTDDKRKTQNKNAEEDPDEEQRDFFELQQEEIDAAIAIQAWYRGAVARRFLRQRCVVD